MALLQDSSLKVGEALLDSILEFYRSELPRHFSQRVIVATDGVQDFFLDTKKVEFLDSLRESMTSSSLVEILTMADSQIVDEDYMIDNIRYKLDVNNKYPWNQSIPDSIFINYLLPYKVVNEYPGHWWNFLEPYYRDSLSIWASPSFQGFDASNARWVQQYTTIYPRSLPMWWTYAPQARTFTKYPSLNEILMLKKGGCYLEAMINVMILRTIGIPATIYEVPFWGSRNGSHAGDVYWSSTAQKMITRYEWVEFDPEYYVRPSKVIRYTYRYTGAFSNGIAPYLKGEKLQIPQMSGDHWYDATADHTAVSDVEVEVSDQIAEKMDMGYIYVMNYGQWVPVHYGRVQGNTLSFRSMGCDVIYRTGFYSGGRHYFITRPFLLDLQGSIRYSEPDRHKLITIQTPKINHGKESGVVSGRNYTLRYLDEEGKWIDHASKTCQNDGELTFDRVPAGAFYFLYTSRDVRHLARIFLIGEKGKQQWY